MEMAGAKEKDVMKVDKKDEVVVEQIAADKAINEEKNKKDKPLAPA